MGDYSIVNGSSGDICGIWLRDSNQASNKNIISMLLMKNGADNLVESALLGNFRIVPNSFDEKGGVFVMFGSEAAPGEVKEQMEKSENEGRMMCLQCQNEDLSKMVNGSKEGDQSLDPISFANGRAACIYHGELIESQMIFVAYPDEAARIRDLDHTDKVFKKLGVGKYAGQGNAVSSQSEVLSRMKELKLELLRDTEQEVQTPIKDDNATQLASLNSDSTTKKWWQFWK